jgi:UDP-N-acetylmuramate--alanine ligase
MRLHFVGVGGSGISGVAKLAEKMGHAVTGCDREGATAYEKNIFKGHSKSHVLDCDLVIASPALFYQKPEIQEITEAKKKGILMSWQEFIGKVLLKDKKIIAIAGTHGKSTTTAMAGKLLVDNGFDPIVMVGAMVPEWGGNYRFGKGDYAVIEADEFNNNFLNYDPDIAIINNIEFDHPDFFKNVDEVHESFKKFILRLRGEKILITAKDSLHKKFSLKVFGQHNQENANMVFVLGGVLGISREKVINSIENFTGISRRMELIAEEGGVKVYDDYAHHPTAIKTTLEGVRQQYLKEKILVIVEPHGFKRTKALLTKYKGVFNSANKVIIGPIYKARDEFDQSITPEIVAKISGHKNAIGLNSLDEIIENSKFNIKNYDIIVVMGAGKSYLWTRKIASVISEPVKFSDITSFRVGGKINKYFEVKTRKEIDEATQYAKNNNLPIFILGDGTDILVSDDDFNGVVIKYVRKEHSCLLKGGKANRGYRELTGSGGLNWDDFVKLSIEYNLQGIECLSGIPGSVGASPIQNIGAYGQELADTFLSLKAYDLRLQKFVTFKKADCKFGYRESIFKTKDFWQKYLITSVTLRLAEGGVPSVKYDSLKKYLEDRKISSPSLLDVRNAVLAIRKTKFEDPKEVGNAGSFFKNPIVTEFEKNNLTNKYPDAKYFPFGEKYKLFAGWLIEQAGWKGKSYKTAAVSNSHALILINPKGKAKAEDVKELSEKIISDIKGKFTISLEREVQLINF